ncbi:hypothetical protein BGX38DRAFT_363782 [Terfezia claveryi]|nr:hypothetical protein BGX38DRAFT_363782 [Terfezia claveryi]
MACQCAIAMALGAVLCADLQTGDLLQSSSGAHDHNIYLQDEVWDVHLVVKSRCTVLNTPKMSRKLELILLLNRSKECVILHEIHIHVLKHIKFVASVAYLPAVT